MAVVAAGRGPRRAAPRAGGDGEGRPHRRRARDGGGHTGQLAGADAVCRRRPDRPVSPRRRASTSSPTPRPLFARAAPPGGDGVSSTRSPAGPAPTWPTLASRGRGCPPLGAETQRALGGGSRRYLRVSNPVDSGGPPVRDWRGRKSSTRIVADPTSPSSSPRHRGPPDDERPLAQDLVDVAATDRQADLRHLGLPRRRRARRTGRSSLGSRRVVVFRTFANCATALLRLLRLLRLPRPTPLPVRRPRPRAVAGESRRQPGDRREPHGQRSGPVRDGRRSGPVEQSRRSGPVGQSRRSGPVGPRAGGAARSETAGGAALSELDSAAVLDAYGIPTAPARLCRSAAPTP